MFFFSLALVISSAPWCPFVWHYCDFYLDLLINLIFILYMCSCVLDCKFIVLLYYYCVQIIYFSVRLKNLKEFYFIFCSLLFYIDWKYLVCSLPLIPLCCRSFCCFSVTLLAVWQTMKVLAEQECVVIVYCLLFLRFLFSYSNHVLLSQKGVECAIPHTANYAGQESWHFIFCLWDL